jgi:hypothetical protein
LDLNNLTTSQLSRRALAIIKEQAAIDSICFPETMNRMLIVNAPMFFPPTWRLIKGWLDPRTSGKIEVISGKAAMEKRLLELVGETELPKDYGGKGPDTHDTIQAGYGETARIATKIMYLRYVYFHHNDHDHDLYPRFTTQSQQYNSLTRPCLLLIYFQWPRIGSVRG